MPYWIFHFFSLNFVLEKVHFVSIRFVWFRSVSFRIVSHFTGTHLKVIILFTEVIFPDYLIPKVISDYLSIAFREKNNDYCGKTCDYISDYTIPGYPLRRAVPEMDSRPVAKCD